MKVLRVSLPEAVDVLGDSNPRSLWEPGKNGVGAIEIMAAGAWTAKDGGSGLLRFDLDGGRFVLVAVPAKTVISVEPPSSTGNFVEAKNEPATSPPASRAIPAEQRKTRR